MTFKTWINDLRDVQSVINNISNTRVIIDGATGLLNANSLKEMSSAVSGLSKEQALLALSTKNLNAAQQKQVLLAAGIISSENSITASAISQALAKTQLSATEKEALLTKLGLIDATTGEAIANATCTKEELLKVLATKGIIGADADAIISSIGLTSANSAQAISFDLLTASIWANIKALGKWLITNPVGWAILGGTAIFGLVKAYDALTDSVEEVKERTENLLESYNSAISESNSNAKTIESLADRYETLSKGVNNLGENVSLTSDEYSEYNDIVNQIADMFPTLITGYTDEGNAILSLKGNVEKLRDAYKEAQTEAYNLLIVSGKDSDGNDIISNYKNQINGKESSLSKTSSYINGEGGAKDAIDIITRLTGALTPDEFRDTYNELYEQYKNIWNSDKIQDALKSSGFEELSHAPKWGELTSDDLAKVKSTAQATIQTYKAEIDSQLKNVDTLANAYLMTNEDYSKLDEQSQTAASLIVNSITEDIANGFKTKEDVGAYVANIVSKIRDNPDLNKSLVDLFTEDFSSMSVDEAKSKLDGYINTIAKVLNEDPVELKIRLGFDDYDDVEPLKTKVQGFLKDEFDDKVGELSLDDLQVASKLEIPEGTLLSWDELKQKIEETKNAASEEIPTFTETLAKVQLLSEGLDQLEKIYQDVLDEEDFDWSNILNNDKFTETFGNMENVTREYKNAYTDFIKTVSNSPNDIKGCQEAFNKLATAYINDSDALKNVTEETRDSVVNMLKDMNIVNADELVDSRLAERTLEAKAATVDFANATKDELSSLIDYANQLGLTSAEVAQLCLNQIDITNNPIDASASLKNLQTLIIKAGVTGEKLGYLLKMVRAINTVTLAVQDGTATDSQITAAERLVDTLKSKMAEVSTANIEAEVDHKPKAKEPKSKSDSEKDFDWIERKIKALESQISSLDKIIDSLYSSTTEKNNALIKQIDLINQEIELQQKAYEGYMAKANAVTLSDNYKELVQNGSIDIETITDKDLQEAISNYQSYYDSAQECLDKINELHENTLDKHVECHDNELSDLKDMLDNQSITEKQYIDEMYRLWEKYYDGQVELAEKAKQQKLEILNEEKSWLESVGNAAIALLDDQVDKLEDQKDKATKIYQDQIDVLNAQKKPLEYELELMERQKDAADKQLQYQKALYALRRAEQQRENYTYTSDKGFIYKADDQTIKDAKKDVSDAEYELLKLNIQQQIDAIDDQIDHLNDLIDQTEKYYDTQIDGLNTYKEEWQKAIDMEELATNMQTFIDKFGADGLQRLFNEDMSLITNWKQSYLDNMAEIDMESTGTIGNLTKKFQELSGLAISPTITAMTDFEQAGTEAANAIANSLAGEEGSLSTAISEVNSKINGGGGSDNKEQSANGEQGQGGQTQDSGSDNLVGAMGELSDTALNEDTGIPAQTQAWTDMLDPLQEVSDKLNDIELTLENLNGKTFSINVEFKSSGASGSANANGNFTGAVIRSGAAFASGTLGASKDETALLGELGNELVVRGNRFFTVGNNGAEMFNVKKGDIIFNHQQTKDLLDKGCAMGHGVAYAEGNAGRVTMTAGIRPFRPGDPTYDMMQQFKTCYSNNVDALNLNTNALNQRHEDFMRQVQNISNSVVNRQQTVTQTINVSLPNINDSSTAQDIMRDLSQISQRAIQRQWR